MADTTLTHIGRTQPRPAGLQGVAADWSSDQRAFKNVSWGKAMMWIFLLSDTFVFGCFLLSYMTARMSTPGAVAQSERGLCPSYWRLECSADPYRHHDLRADLEQRNDGDGGEFRLSPRPPQNRDPHASDSSTRRDLRRHAGFRMDQADQRRVRPWGNPWGRHSSDHPSS